MTIKPQYKYTQCGVDCDWKANSDDLENRYTSNHLNNHEVVTVLSLQCKAFTIYCNV